MIFKKIIKKKLKYLNFIKNTHLSFFPRVSILLYHRINDKYLDHPYGSIVSKDKFKNQINFLKNNYNISSMNDLYLQIKNNYFNFKHQVVITFDDGTVDNYTNAYPLLKDLSFPATFFLLTDYVNSESVTWDWRLYEIIYNTNNLDNFSKSSLSFIKFSNKKNLLYKLVYYLKYLDPMIRNNYIDELSDLLLFNKFDIKYNRSLNWNEIKEMSSKIFEFGSHGCSHTSLVNQVSNFYFKELKISKNTIENHLSKECSYFSFPFGSKDDFNKKLINEASLLYNLCFLNVNGVNNLTNKNFVFKRIIMEENTDLRYIF